MLSTRVCNAGAGKLASALSRAYANGLVSCIGCRRATTWRGLTTSYSLKSAQQQPATQVPPEHSIQETMRLLEADIGPLSQQPMVCAATWSSRQPRHLHLQPQWQLIKHTPNTHSFNWLHGLISFTQSQNVFCILACVSTGALSSTSCDSDQWPQRCRQGCSTQTLATS